MKFIDSLFSKKNKSDAKQDDQSQETNVPPSLQRHVDANRNYLFTSVRVRIFLGELERDLLLKIRNQDLVAKDICQAISNHLKIPKKYASMFRLWTFGKDLELQLDPEQKMTDLLLKWHVVMLQYTHYTEAATAANPINRYFFVFKRAAILSRSSDKDALNCPIATKLLYGEAKRNLLNNRYIINIDKWCKFAAYQLYNRFGEYDEKNSARIISDPQIIHRLIPAKCSVDSAAIKKIIQEYKNLPKFCDAMAEFLTEAIALPFYGSCFFHVCEQRPPLGYFEHRVQRWLLGINDIGMYILDPNKSKYEKIFIWEQTTWESSPLDIKIFFPNEKSDESILMKLLSPQAPIIDNVATRAKYIWAKNVLKEHMNYSIDTHKIDMDSVKDEMSPGQNFKMKDADEFTFDSNGDKKFTSISQSSKHTRKPITWHTIWTMIRSPMQIKKPGEVLFDIDDGISDVGSVQQLNLI